MAEPSAAWHEAGRRVYNFRCYFCHGYSGNAKTLAGTFVSPPPRDFTHADSKRLSREVMIDAVTRGRSGTAMMAFDKTLTQRDIEAVVDFVRREFMLEARENTRYHTAENGWPEHDKYRAAYPFALGQMSVDVSWDQLDSEQKIGKRVFLSSCVSCHDRGYAPNESALWELRPLSFPRNGYSHVDSGLDGVSGASPYAVHEIAPTLSSLSLEEQAGEQIFQRNCAFCHAADGTGRNWIGSFLDAHPRDLTGARVASLSDKQLHSAISNGVVGTTMPAWKSVLTEQQINAVVAYVKRAFVANDDATLSNIRLERNESSRITQ